MRRERCFRLRGKEVCLQELTDLVALHLPSARTKETARGVAGFKREALDAVAPEVTLPQVRAFEDAGWVFFTGSEYAEHRSGAQRAKVFVRQGGRLALSTNTLVVRLPGDPSERQAGELLQPHGCRVLEKLSFAAGLFRVELTEQASGDALDAANELPASGVCEFAEPELIEMTGGR